MKNIKIFISNISVFGGETFNIFEYACFRYETVTDDPPWMMMSSGLTTHQPLRVICVKMVN